VSDELKLQMVEGYAMMAIVTKVMRTMPKKLSKIEREIRDHPERFDFGDVPPDRVNIPAQEKRLDDMRPQWAKDLAASNKRG
jgi:hypothetical protein